ncbi:MAG: tetratricopeptide repeat protein [Nitrospinota bacterium]
MTDVDENPDSKSAGTDESSSGGSSESKADEAAKSTAEQPSKPDEPDAGKPPSGEATEPKADSEVKPSPVKKSREYEKIGRCFEVESGKEKSTGSEKADQESSVNHYYIEMLDNKKIALEKVDDDGEPTGEMAEEGISVDEFHKRYKTCSHHDCPLQPRTIDEIRKKMSDNRVELAEEHLKNGELDLAEDKFNRALKYDEESVRAQLGIGKVRMEQDKIDEAMKIFSEISESNAIYEMANKHTFNDFGIYLRKKNLNDLAIDNYEKAISIDDKDAALYFNLSRAYAEKGDVQTGIAKMKEALNIRPDFPEAKEHLDILIKREAEMLDSLLTKKTDTE